MQCLFHVHKACFNYRWKFSVHQKSGFYSDRILKRLVPGKKSHLKQGGQIVRLISFSYGNSGYSISIFTNVCFACQDINIADHYR